MIYYLIPVSFNNNKNYVGGFYGWGSAQGRGYLLPPLHLASPSISGTDSTDIFRSCSIVVSTRPHLGNLEKLYLFIIRL